jgi:hypothetical protein
MVEPGQGLSFPAEPFGKVRLSLLIRRQNLQRNEPIESRLAGFINNAHAAPAEAFKDFQLRETLRDLRWRRPGLCWPYSPAASTGIRFIPWHFGRRLKVQFHEAARTKSLQSAQG